MSEFIRSVIVQNASITAGDVKTYDLPVNPLSHLLLNVQCLNVTDEGTLAEILARISKVEVLHRGASVISLSGADLFALNMVQFGNNPLLTNQVATDNATRNITLIVPFGRKLYNGAECFPATRKGELQLQVTFSSTETAVDNVVLQVESVELMGASPTRYQKVTTLSKTPGATGDLDVDLPIANMLAGIILFSTTVPTGTATTTTVDTVKLLADNKETMFALANWESLHGELLNRVGHREEYDGSADNDDISKYALMDFVPNSTDEYLVDTKKYASLKLRISAGDTNVLRALPVELVEVSGV